MTKTTALPPIRLQEVWPTRFFSWPPMFRWAEPMFEPNGFRVETFSEDGTYVVRAELPGIDPEKGLDVEVTDNRLRIRAERRSEEQVEEKSHYRSEMRYGVFVRVLPLPAGANGKEVTASYKDGILEVRVPVSKPTPDRTKVPVTSA